MIRHGDLKVGDRLYSESGRAVEIVGETATTYDLDFWGSVYKCSLATRGRKSQFYTEQEHLERVRRTIDRRALLLLVGSLSEDDIKKLLRMFESSKIEKAREQARGDHWWLGVDGLGV